MKKIRVTLEKGGRQRGIRYHAETWSLQHLQACIFSLGQFCRNPLASFLTASVIGISLALPAGFFVILDNAKRITSGWESSVQITAFLAGEIDKQKAEQLAIELVQGGRVEKVVLITREKALEEYRQLSGFSEALDALVFNPLPNLLLIEPRLREDPEQSVDDLLNLLEARAEVDKAQYDQQWIKRLNAIIGIIQRTVLIMSIFLCLAVLLIIGNTIRMLIYHRRPEIEIAKLFGATDRFIQRPFLYSGFWYGLCGSIIAWILISLSLFLLHDPARQLASLYHSGFTLSGLGPQEVLILLCSGIGLGWIGSFISVRRHLAAIEPV